MKQFFLKLFTWWNGQTFGTQLFTWRKGIHIGDDEFGNRYYKADNVPPFGERRWVIYKNEADASKIPPGWHGWIHHRSTLAPSQTDYQKQSWEQPHQPNMTGTALAYRPPGSILTPEKRPEAVGDYEAWSPSD